MTRLRAFIAPLVVLVVAALLPLLLSEYWVGIGVLVLMWAYLATGWNLLGGYGGQHSLGHGLFMGIGAYLSAYLIITYQMNAWITLVLGVILAGAVGGIIGWATFRYGLKGAYFALVTIALTEMAAALAGNWDVVGGAGGLSIPVPSGNNLLNIQFESKTGYYYFALVMMLLGVVFVRWMVGRRFGYRLVAVRENEDAAEALGVGTLRTKIWATAVSAAMCAVGGSFYILYIGYVDPRSVFGETVSVQILLFAIIGGLSTIWGPLVGAAVLVPVAELARKYFGQEFGAAPLLVYAGVLILTMLFMPNGFVGVAKSVRRQVRRGPGKEGPLVPESSERRELADKSLNPSGETQPGVEL